MASTTALRFVAPLKSWARSGFEYFTLYFATQTATTLMAEQTQLHARIARLGPLAEAALQLSIDDAPQDADEVLKRAEDTLAEITDAHPSLSALLLAQRASAPGSQDASFDERHRVIEHSVAVLRGAVMSPSQRGFVRVQRAVLLVITLSAFLMFVRWMTKPDTVIVVPSSSWGSPYFASNVTDHDPNTNWLLPDHATGWIELRFSSQVVRSIHLLNVQGLPAYGTTACTLKLLSRGREVRTMDLDLSTSVNQTRPFVATLDPPVQADAVRIEITGTNRLGAGFAALEIH
ncbi:MAG: discoidin domain-containing protein [Deltaproteobacteria bacterium]|nr:discoidin domain-containing protein [Deltaproteobacteria bacterium]